MIIGIDVYVCASVWLCECGDGEKDFVCDQLWRNKYIFVRAPMNSFFFQCLYYINSYRLNIFKLFDTIFLTQTLIVSFLFVG